MTIDPDGKTFWYLGEYSKDTGTNNGRWGTHIQSFSFAGCGGGTPVFTLGAPVPGNAGASNSFAVSNATANAGLTLVSGLRTGNGTVTVTGCPNPIPVAVRRASVRATGTADGSGSASLTDRLPRWWAGRSVTFQAIDEAACTASPPVTVTIN
jgi:hypothetical protein